MARYSTAREKQNGGARTQVAPMHEPKNQFSLTAQRQKNNFLYVDPNRRE